MSGAGSGNLTVAATWGKRLRGLLGCTEFSGVLLLAPCRDIHTYGMRFSIDVAFADSNGFVLAAYRDVAPGRRIRCRGAACVVERMADPHASWYGPQSRLRLSIFAMDNGERDLI